TTLTAAEPWCAGRWDSTFQMYWRHPCTVAVRVEVVDQDTRYPIPGVEVSLEGQWDEYVAANADPRGLNMGNWEMQKESSVKRTYKLTAQTDDKGIAVFGLNWHDRFNVRDDIAKVEKITCRHKAYRFQESPLTLFTLIQEREAWKTLFQTYPGTRLFLLIKEGFKGYANENSTQALFFQMIRDESYSYVYPEDDLDPRFPRDFIVSTPQKEAGPYLVIPLAIGLERAFAAHQVETTIRLPKWGSEHDRGPEPENDSRGASWRDKVSEKARAMKEKTSELAGKTSNAISRMIEKIPEKTQSVRDDSQVPTPLRFAALNITGSDLDPTNRQEMGLPFGVKGVVVNGSDNPSGLEPGMVIESIDHRYVGQSSALQEMLGKRRSGDQISVGVWRTRSGKWVRDTVVVKVP
ncbi:MAG: hypothetical protein AAB393_04355, partial [Bacteroidota bacterium]